MPVRLDHSPPIRPFDALHGDEGPWLVQYWTTAYCPHLGQGGPYRFDHRVRTGLIRNGRHLEEHARRQTMYVWCMDNLGTSVPPRWACDESQDRGANRVETIFYFADERDATLFKIMCC